MSDTTNRQHAARVAVIGLGRIAWRMEQDPLRPKPCTHVGAYLRQGCELVAGCDIDPQQRKAFACHYPSAQLYEHYQAMLEAQSAGLGPLDALSLCAYATERRDMLLAAIDRGVPALFCEKAFATSLEEADEMVARLAAANIRCVVGHMRRWVPDYRNVARLLAEGAIGTVQSVVVRFSGSIIHTGTHLFDVLQWWFGTPLAVSGHVDERPGTDTQSGYRFAGDDLGDLGGHGRILFANDVVAHVEGRVKEYFICEFELIGSRGRIMVGNEGLRVFLPGDSPRMSGFSELRQVQPAPCPPLPWVTAWDGAVRSLFSREPNPATAEDARAALELALAFYVSHRQGGREVGLPLPREGLRVASR